MKLNKTIVSLALVGATVAGSANAAELVVASGSSKASGVEVVSLDVMTEGNARGLQAILQLPKGAKVSTDGCLASLPKGFQGECRASGGEVSLMLFAFNNQTLPSGLVELGTIKVSGHKLGSEVKVANFKVVDAAGKPISSSTTVAGGRDVLRREQQSRK